MIDMKDNSGVVHRKVYSRSGKPTEVAQGLTIVHPTIRTAVCNLAGEELGDVKQFMQDSPSGQVCYAVLSLMPSLGTGTKLFAVPSTMFQFDADHQRLVLDLAKAGASGLWSFVGF